MTGTTRRHPAPRCRRPCRRSRRSCHRPCPPGPSWRPPRSWATTSTCSRWGRSDLLQVLLRCPHAATLWICLPHRLVPAWVGMGGRGRGQARSRPPGAQRDGMLGGVDERRKKWAHSLPRPTLTAFWPTSVGGMLLALPMGERRRVCSRATTPRNGRVTRARWLGRGGAGDRERCAGAARRGGWTTDRQTAAVAVSRSHSCGRAWAHTASAAMMAAVGGRRAAAGIVAGGGRISRGHRGGRVCDHPSAAAQTCAYCVRGGAVGA